jgi:hypothetical protein
VIMGAVEKGVLYFAHQTIVLRAIGVACLRRRPYSGPSTRYSNG